MNLDKTDELRLYSACKTIGVLLQWHEDTPAHVIAEDALRTLIEWQRDRRNGYVPAPGLPAAEECSLETAKP